MKNIVKLLASLTLFGAAACAPAEPTLSPEFGNAVRHNMAAHIINPDYRAEAAPSALDGARAGLAIQNYRLGIRPDFKPVATTDVSK
jgi:type IV pilus biogenesis protein CpaD/CtpE